MRLDEKIKHSKIIIDRIYSEYEVVLIANSLGKDSVVVAELCRQVLAERGELNRLKMFWIRTPMKPAESLDLKLELEDWWNAQIEVHMSESKVIEGIWERSPDLCCEIFKVRPWKEAIKNADVVVTGLRRDEGKTRHEYQEEESYIDGMTKLNPILIWTEREVWHFTAAYRLPVHPFYKEGYRSLGCVPCSKIIDENEPERAGRWAGTSKCGGECGIHTLAKGD